MKSTDDWISKLSNPAQVGGIETSILDNGPGRGTRIAWVNTGAGLRYKVVIDRGLDIADAFHNSSSLAWISHVGVVGTQPSDYRGIDWLSSFGGGLLTTCGLDHVGGPEKDEHGVRGLHGQVSRLPATIESIIQPDPSSGQLDMSITGVMRQSQPLGTQIVLKRMISSKLGNPEITIRDEVVNQGNTAAPHMLLYHMNLGWPLVDEDVDICWKGEWKSREGDTDAKIFRVGLPFRKGKPPLEAHIGSGEEAAFIDVEADKAGKCTCGIYNAKIGIALAIEFNKNEFPWLTNWQHWGPGEYVVGLEPGTHPPIGQGQARKDGTLIMLQPKERRRYEVKIRILAKPEEIKRFLLVTEHKEN